MSEKPQPAFETQPQFEPQPEYATEPKAASKSKQVVKPLFLAVALAATTAAAALAYIGFGSSSSGGDEISPQQAAARQAAFDAARSNLRFRQVNLSDPQQRQAVVKAMALSADDEQRFQQAISQASPAVIIVSLWDDYDQDGDIVSLSVGTSYRITVPLTHAVQHIPVVLEPGQQGFTLTAQVDGGGGGATVAISSNGRIVPLPPLAPGTSLFIPHY